MLYLVKKKKGGSTITYLQFEQAYRSAGGWFLALYMEAFLLRIKDLNNDLDNKKKLIDEIYNNGDGPDNDRSGTITRVNAMMRIINGKRVMDALEKAAFSEKLLNEFYEAYETANVLIERINHGAYNLEEIYRHL